MKQLPQFLRSEEWIYQNPGCRSAHANFAFDRNIQGPKYSLQSEVRRCLDSFAEHESNV